MSQKNMFEHLGKVVDALVSDENSDITRFFKSMFGETDTKPDNPQRGCCGGGCSPKPQRATRSPSSEDGFTGRGRATSNALFVLRKFDPDFQALAEANGLKVGVSSLIFNELLRLANEEDNQDALQLLNSNILEISESC